MADRTPTEEQAAVRQDLRARLAARRAAVSRESESADAPGTSGRALDTKLRILELVLASDAPPSPAPRAQLSACVRAAMEAAKLPRSMGVVVNVGDGLDVTMDAPSLTIAVRLLIDNAREAAGAQGHVAVVAKRAADQVTLRVVDDGPGLPPERLSQPARPVEPPREGHAGLGLALVFHLVRRVGGEVSVKNAERGTGAVVELTLPSAPSR